MRSWHPLGALGQARGSLKGLLERFSAGLSIQGVGVQEAPGRDFEHFWLRFGSLSGGFLV